MVQPANKRLVTEASLAVAVDAEAALARNADNLDSGTIDDARIPSTIARDSEVSDAIAIEAALARDATNLTTGTIQDARIPSGIARDSEVTAAITAAQAATVTNGDTTHSPTGEAVYEHVLAAVAVEAADARNANNLTSGTVADARIASTIARDSEVAAGYQPLDADLTAIAALAPANDDIIQRKSGAWVKRTLAELWDDLKATTVTLTNKTINLSNNTLSGTLAQFNAAVSDADLAPTASPTFTGNMTAADITASGTVDLDAATAVLVPTALPGDNDTTAASTAFVVSALAAAGSIIPPAVVSPYAGSTAPAGWLLADGTAVSRTGDNAGLFAVIGTTYGAGNGTTTFNLPNLKGKVPVGRDAAEPFFDTLNDQGGARTVTLAASQIPAHSHGLTGGYRSDLAATGGSSAVSSVGGLGTGAPIADTGNTDNSTGGGGAHENMPPFVILNYIIKL